MSVRGAEPEALFTGIFFCLVVCLTSEHTHTLPFCSLSFCYTGPSSPLQPSAVRPEARWLASSCVAELLPLSAEHADPAIPSFFLDTGQVGRFLQPQQQTVPLSEQGDAGC